MNLLFEIFFPGRPIVKKNTQRVVGYGKGKRAIYSKKYIQWKRQATLMFLRSDKIETLTQPLYAEYRFYFKNHHAEPDTSNLIEGPQDLLKEARIIKDDRLIKRLFAEKFFGQDKIGTEIKLYELGDAP